MKDRITNELNAATDYLRAMIRTGVNKQDCENVLMHLANIDDIIAPNPPTSIQSPRASHFERSREERSEQPECGCIGRRDKVACGFACMELDIWTKNPKAIKP